MLVGARNGERFYHKEFRVMTTELREAMTAGVLIEVNDRNGQVLGHAVYAPWWGRPLPKIGDTLSCAIASASGRTRRVQGQVTARHFELQHEDDGQPCVWVRISMEARQPNAVTSKTRRARFSTN